MTLAHKIIQGYFKHLMCLHFEFVYFKTITLLSISYFFRNTISPQVPLCVLVVLPYGQAAPRGLLTGTSEVIQAKAELMDSFQAALSQFLSKLAPSSVQDTQEVEEAKEEFFKIFDKALNGMVETFLYTPEQVVARKGFHQAYKDAESGKVGAQYLEDTAEVKAAKEMFSKFFQFVLDGMLYKLAPKPGHTVIPKEIADFFIKDAPDVAAEKLTFDKLTEML